MEKQELIQLTNELYRLTLLFPKKEPLRYRLRAVADDILAGALRITNGYEYTNLKDLEVLEAYLAVAVKQNWVKPIELLRIGEKYASLRKGLEDAESKVFSETPAAQNAFSFVNESGTRSNFQRQDKILEILKEKGRAQVWEFKGIFPEVSKRTLRRDFEYLVNQNLVERVGEKNQTFYTSKIQVGHEVGQR